MMLGCPVARSLTWLNCQQKRGPHPYKGKYTRFPKYSCYSFLSSMDGNLDLEVNTKSNNRGSCAEEESETKHA